MKSRRHLPVDRQWSGLDEVSTIRDTGKSWRRLSDTFRPKFLFNGTQISVKGTIISQVHLDIKKGTSHFDFLSSSPY